MQRNPVLLVQECPTVLSRIKEILRQNDFQWVNTDSVQKGMRYCSDGGSEITLLDPHMEDNRGYELLHYISESCPRSKAIVVTSSPSVQGAVQAIKRGAIDYFSADLLDTCLPPALNRVNAMLEASENRTGDRVVNIQADVGLVGKSKQFRAVLHHAGKAAKNNENILIQGESGTGKELLARFIHYRSNRSDEPFIPVNCGAIPRELFESELFGHVKGSYTGANETRSGFFQAANGGTIFLDEAGTMPMGMQAKLLRVIEDKEIWKVGDRKPDCIDVKVIAATNKNLSRLVEQGRFREDLFYRLNVIPLTMPPLRERGDDVRVLCDYFARKYAQEFDKGPIDFSPEVLRKLERYEWPGNVRELENIVKRMIMFSETPVIRACEIPTSLQENTVASENNGSTLAEMEKSHIKNICEQTGWNIMAAARILDIGRRSLYRKLHKYHLGSY